MRIYRLDIASFYDSVDRDFLLSKLDATWDVTRESIAIITRIFAGLKARLPKGLPRGLSISATLAEYYLRDFDMSVRSHPEVFFYARFVDDILVMTTGYENDAAFEAWASSKLPPGLCFSQNPKKHTIVGWNDAGKFFEYLGYRFERGLVSSDSGRVDVKIDMASSKIVRTKTKMCAALKAHCSRPNYDLLLDRIRFLSSNYIVGRRSKHQALRAGIYYSYARVNQFHSRSALRALDDFLRRLLLGNITTLSRLSASKLSASERHRLLKISFRVGHQQRRMCRMSPARLDLVTRCWQHV